MSVGAGHDLVHAQEQRGQVGGHARLGGVDLAGAAAGRAGHLPAPDLPRAVAGRAGLLLGQPGGSEGVGRILLQILGVVRAEVGLGGRPAAALDLVDPRRGGVDAVAVDGAARLVVGQVATLLDGTVAGVADGGRHLVLVVGEPAGGAVPRLVHHRASGRPEVAPVRAVRSRRSRRQRSSSLRSCWPPAPESLRAWARRRGAGRRPSSLPGLCSRRRCPPGSPRSTRAGGPCASSTLTAPCCAPTGTSPGPGGGRRGGPRRPPGSTRRRRRRGAAGRRRRGRGQERLPQPPRVRPGGRRTGDPQPTLTRERRFRARRERRWRATRRRWALVRVESDGCRVRLV